MKIKSLAEVGAVRDYLNRVGAEPRSIKTAVVKEGRGKYWKDIAIIRFDRDGEVRCNTLDHAPTDQERDLIKAALGEVTWPELKLLKTVMNPPDAISKAQAKDVFEFRNKDGLIVMIQVRSSVKGDKIYTPWTYWDDDEWRCMEPEGDLPIYNAHRLKDASIVFIHEGGKAARAVQDMVDSLTPGARSKLAAHPWGREMASALHLGWIGGALSAERSDWSVLREQGIKRAYIVSDNDEPGRQALPKISKQLHCPTFSVQFTDEFPASFDLADDFPEKMFGEVDGGRFYIGPSFRDCLHPATWATDQVQPPEGRPYNVLRDSFRNMWAYIDESDVYVCKEMPEIVRTESILNKMVAPFSNVKETSHLILKAYNGRAARICYRPDEPGLSVTYQGSSAINLHVPGSVVAKPGDYTPWEEYLKYMFVNEREVFEVKRWLATLIARPGVRMSYGLLLVSEKQGIGKTTLGSHILPPLLGHHNVGFPGESDILSDYNDWVAMKRLAVISEIYSGHSWKAYNSLKAVITDRDIRVNQKYMRQYNVENWCHIIACSNSMRALKIENDDRRWLYPEMTEVPWPGKKFTDFRRWVDSGGLSIIKFWAEEFGEYVSTSDRAPMTERKKDLIEGSRSEAQREAAAIAEAVIAFNEPIALTMKDVVGWCRSNAQGKVFDSDYEIRKVMVETGMFAFHKRLKVGTRMEYVVINPTLQNIINGNDAEAAMAIRSAVKKCNEVMEGGAM